MTEKFGLAGYVGGTAKKGTTAKAAPFHLTAKDADLAADKKATVEAAVALLAKTGLPFELKVAGLTNG